MVNMNGCKHRREYEKNEWQECWFCGEMKPQSDFIKDNIRYNGLGVICRECRKKGIK